jgi:hypothetical protein
MEHKRHVKGGDGDGGEDSGAGGWERGGRVVVYCGTVHLVSGLWVYKNTAR